MLPLPGLGLFITHNHLKCSGYTLILLCQKKKGNVKTERLGGRRNCSFAVDRLVRIVHELFNQPYAWISLRMAPFSTAQKACNLLPSHHSRARTALKSHLLVAFPEDGLEMLSLPWWTLVLLVLRRLIFQKTTQNCLWRCWIRCSRLWESAFFLACISNV